MSDHEDIKSLTERVRLLEEKNQKLETEIARYRGFAGGIIFVFTGIWAIVEIILPFLKAKIGT